MSKMTLFNEILLIVFVSWLYFFIIYRPYFHLQEKRTNVACLGLQQTRKYLMVSRSMLNVIYLEFHLQTIEWIQSNVSDILHLQIAWVFLSAYKSSMIIRFLPLECKDGYFGSKCGKLCRYPNYGKLCQFHCNCTEEDCDHISGCQGTKRRLFLGIFFLENTHWVNRRLVNDFNWYCFSLLNAGNVL